MSMERTPANPDPNWDRLVADLTAAPAEKPAGPVLQKTADVPVNRPDLLGDMPLTPKWARTSTGWRARAAVGKVNSVRAFRRWVRRQNTEHGHTAQVFRGMHRTFLWIQGTEGVQVATARREVQQAQADYKTAKFGHGIRLIPTKEKDRRRAAMEKAFAGSVTAMTKYRSAQRDARTRRGARGALVAAAVAVPEGAGIYLIGGTGGVIATGSALLALALIGRRTMGGELYIDREAKIGDGDRLNEEMLNRVYRDARIISSDAVLGMLTPCVLTADGAAWEASFDLPSGTPTEKATAVVPALASGFGVTKAQVSQTGGDREGRINLRVSRKIPFTSGPVPGPLLHVERFDLWNAVPMGVSERGEPVATEWFEKTGLFGGEPGSGKTSIANNLLLAAALDPTARLFLGDGKAGNDLRPFADIAEAIDTEGDPEALLQILEHVWQVILPECKRLAREHGVAGFSQALATQDPRVRFTVLAIDEWASYMAMAEPKVAKELERLLRLIVQQGRAYGVIVLAATQKPDADAVPSGIRDIISTRWAGRCLTPQASDTILGQGRAKLGFNGQNILKDQRGVGLYQTGETADPTLMLSYFYDDGRKSGVNEVALLLERAFDLRAKAGTLPAGSVPLADQLRALGDDQANILAALVDAFDVRSGSDGRPAEWLPGAVLIEYLTASGMDVSADALGRLVVRTDEDKVKRAWEGSRVFGYPRSRVLITVRDRFGLGE
ncbi:hypothetical protein ACFYRI_14820 [Streptomyces microflavus]|uniref:hypothetical protein n=1 Tax=Streptomyces microflavus TaxID=1919 RepID=UPI0036790C6C